MSNWLLPANDENFILTVAKSISREQLFSDSDKILRSSLGYGLDDDPLIRARIETEFELMWNNPKDEIVRQRYIALATEAINTINLYLLTVVD